MKTDLSEAAKFYGLHKVPPVRYDPKQAEGEISFTPSLWTIFYDDNFLHAGDSYDQGRFEKVGVGPLSHEDAMRFILAHELYHAVQWELDPNGALCASLRENESEAINTFFSSAGIAEDEGDEIHDSDLLEHDADVHAAKAYKLIKITL